MRRFSSYALIGLALVALGGGCGGAAKKEVPVPQRPIATVLAERSEELLALPGVTVVYEGALDDGSPCIKIGVSALDDDLTVELPDSLEGYPVLIVNTGDVGPR